MSTYWGYHCKTCPDDAATRDEYDVSGPYSETWMNHGEATLRSLVPLAPHFVAIHDGDTTGYVELTIMAYGPSPIYWLREHAGHDIELHNEYGEVEPINEARRAERQAGAAP